MKRDRASCAGARGAAPRAAAGARGADRATVKAAATATATATAALGRSADASLRLRRLRDRPRRERGRRRGRQRGAVAVRVRGLRGEQVVPREHRVGDRADAVPVRVERGVAVVCAALTSVAAASCDARLARSAFCPATICLTASSFVRSSRADALSASLRACISTAERKPTSYRGIVTPTNTPPP
ncbi:hypothetical protein BURPS1710b_1761 [Burkholderia pseudomallei 1710b]|uniref:Uncharacterized protein n=1 Tax=Burkholderia pseudomallei (strain 1710b) TaxID=320372 RepID=Q3JTE1_BURP1|nr:hypothetical protein BURPS1710b_1761 [Burkholderia pseudomallei 1710b]